MQTKSVRAVRKLDGTIHAEVLVSIKETGEVNAYKIEQPLGGEPYSMIDGARHDLTEREVEALRKAVAEVRDEGVGGKVHDPVRGRAEGRRRGKGRRV